MEDIKYLLGFSKKAIYPVLMASQIMYHILCLYEMGSIYWHPVSVAYRVGSLLPALYLAVKLYQRQKEIYAKRIAQVYAYGSILLVAAYILFRLYCSIGQPFISLFHNIKTYTLNSVQNEVTWLVYYWGVTQYPLCLVIAYEYLHYEKN